MCTFVAEENTEMIHSRGTTLRQKIVNITIVVTAMLGMALTVYGIVLLTN